MKGRVTRVVNLDYEKYMVYIGRPSKWGKILGCYCKPLPCHGDVLVDLIIKGEDYAKI